jgi:hypothetical protein
MSDPRRIPQQFPGMPAIEISASAARIGPEREGERTLLYLTMGAAANRGLPSDFAMSKSLSGLGAA